MSISNETLPGEDVLLKLADDIRTAKADGAAANQAIATALKNAEKNSNVHKAAFKAIVTLVAKNEDKQTDFMLHFDHYAKVFGLRRQMDLYGADDPQLSEVEERELEEAGA